MRGDCLVTTTSRTNNNYTLFRAGPGKDSTSSPLDEQQVHAGISEDDEDGAENSQANGILPQRKNIKAETAQNGGTRNLDIKTILVVNERKILDLIDNKALEAIVEDGQLYNG